MLRPSSPPTGSPQSSRAIAAATTFFEFFLWASRRKRAPGSVAGPNLRSTSMIENQTSSRWTWKGEKLWPTGMSSIVLMLTCAGCDAAQCTASAMFSASSGRMPA